MSNIEILTKGLQELDLELDNDMLRKFELYKELLKEWNEKINITAITNDEEIDIKHFLDSITVFKTGIIEPNKNIIDIGTGGGFPGLPIKIINENVNVVLLDSLNKRIKFLDEVISKLELKGISTIHGRAEDFGLNPDYREKFDIAVSRAVASLNILLEYCMPFVKKGGYFIAMKGPDVEEELIESKNALRILGGEIEKRIDINIPGSDIVHNLIIIKKISNTPTKYPRTAGKPKKNPL